MKQVKIVPMAAEHLDRLEQLERMCFSRPWSMSLILADHYLKKDGNRFIYSD